MRKAAGGPDDSNWFPIYWTAGQKGVKWAAAAGPQNVFFDNTMTKQLATGGPYLPYYPDKTTIYQFGVSGGVYHPLDVGGTPIADWAHHEQNDYTGGHGVDASRTDAGPSPFLKTVGPPTTPSSPTTPPTTAPTTRPTTAPTTPPTSVPPTTPPTSLPPTTAPAGALRAWFAQTSVLEQRVRRSGHDHQHWPGGDALDRHVRPAGRHHGQLAVERHGQPHRQPLHGRQRGVQRNGEDRRQCVLRLQRRRHRPPTNLTVS